MKRSLPTMRQVAIVLTACVFSAVVIAVVKLNPGGPRPASAAPPDPQATHDSAVVRFAETGELLRPTGYRRWTYVGTPLTPNDMNDGGAAFPEFHNVYINPEAYDHYEQAGEFPDGTVMVKELVSVGSKQASSGKGYFMGDFIGLEVSIKDKARFQDEPGNWAFFSFGHEYPLSPVAGPQRAANCSACHGSLAGEDFVFTQYYPVLRAAKSSAE